MGELLVSGRVLNLFSFQQLVAKLSDNSEQKNDPTGGDWVAGHDFPWVGSLGCCCQSTKVDDPIIEPFPCWDPLDMIPKKGRLESG